MAVVFRERKNNNFFFFHTTWNPAGQVYITNKHTDTDTHMHTSLQFLAAQSAFAFIIHHGSFLFLCFSTVPGILLVSQGCSTQQADSVGVTV